MLPMSAQGGQHAFPNSGLCGPGGDLAGMPLFSVGLSLMDVRFRGAAPSKRVRAEFVHTA